MKRLLHISDLHFGRDRPELLDPLVAIINDLAPDLVAISGDLTQRARAKQFMRAREMIDRIEAPVLTVPGNHDTPLDNLFERVFTPWRRYKKWIDTDLEPQIRDEDWTIIGVNSVNPLGWQRGWFDRADIKTVRTGFEGTAKDAFRIVVVHHPLEHLPGERKRLMRGAKEGIAALAELNTDIVLSGHLHSWRADVFASALQKPSVLLVQAGTGLSERVRGEDNDFNLLSFGDNQVLVERFASTETGTGFEKVRSAQFTRQSDGWKACEP